ncbi:hypothetical protein VP01_2125g7 [Puccinia sorghi]|uniref:Uncharacterized protein n=1 Tax=Puccinia sorghi TaxID=27349 RepID=A0A0L6V9Y4_9BASI|nr:hypothetical protein VP01_2125g7 [Puccinia sorghi]
MSCGKYTESLLSDTKLNHTSPSPLVIMISVQSKRHTLTVSDKENFSTFVLEARANHLGYTKKSKPNMYCASLTERNSMLYKPIQDLAIEPRLDLETELFPLVFLKNLIPGMSIGECHVIQTLNLLMEEVCLRRTKEVFLNIPKKVEKAVLVKMDNSDNLVSHGT